MNKSPVKAQVYKTIEEYNAAGPGAIFLWRYFAKVFEGGEKGFIKLKCPGCGEDGTIHVRNDNIEHPGDSPSWTIKGIPDNITLHPSLNCRGCCGWHGWLKDGIFKI
jgi:hypothetical protein